MDQDRPKRRKCGPRVKTGCITCRIRRVKCDEGKPDCQRCVSTGRKCDGYVTQQKTSHTRSNLRPNDRSVDIVRRPSVALTSPVESSENPRARQLFHFYCNKSAFDLSVYLNSEFWHNMILQQSQHHHVVRQAVIAFGSAHLYALSLNQNKDFVESKSNALEPARQYDLAIRSLREYMENDSNPDPHVVLVCCALFLSCENARGNRAAAWQHLENGLSILRSVEGRKSKKLLTSGNEVSSELELVASKYGSKLKAKTDKVDIDEELIYVFSRLDVQATLCEQSRPPALNLAELSKPAISEASSEVTTFTTMTDAQRSLDYVHNRLARFLHMAAISQPQASPAATAVPPTPEPDWLESERAELDGLCLRWKTSMEIFIQNQDPVIQQHLQSRFAPTSPSNVEWHAAVQIQLLVLHHRCWWMLFRSYHNPSVYTAIPNPDAAEILDICEFLGYALPLRPSAVYSMTEADVAWKMISEIGVTAPLFVLATKCSDPSIISRALGQLIALRNHGNGLYHESFLDEVIKSVLLRVEHEPIQPSDIPSGPDPHHSKPTAHSLQPAAPPPYSVVSPQSDLDTQSEPPASHTLQILNEPQSNSAGGLLGWSKEVPTLRN